MSKHPIRLLLIVALSAPVFVLSACNQTGAYRGGASVHVSYGSPWRWGGGYYPIDIPPDIDFPPEPELPIEPTPPIAVPLPEPDFGGDFGGGDFGGGDWGGDFDGDFGGDF